MAFLGLTHQAVRWLPILWQRMAALALLLLVFVISIQRRSTRQLCCKVE